MLKVLFACFFALICTANALYFTVNEGQKRCFLVEVPQDVLVQASYKSLDFERLMGSIPADQPPRPATQLIVEVMDPSQKQVLSRPTETEGSFGFTSIVPGEYQVCVYTDTSDWFGQKRQFRFELLMESGHQAIDYAEVAQEEHLTAIEVEIRKLNDKIRSIRNEQMYQKSREEQFRNTSESTNARVMWWSIMQTIILLGSAVFQIHRLKTFFMQKKLV
eukprot:TRINITY_DN2255_c0_g1_i1.p1 TRINITY_DN2255_c0_g1~~TRINITY_DN2255_c0_g1_i1.p1  ORF type:complete len:219 (-),score=53.01 TRINITY_DN2255_c0_g1_i1:182-838(-)